MSHRSNFRCLMKGKSGRGRSGGEVEGDFQMAIRHLLPQLELVGVFLMHAPRSHCLVSAPDAGVPLCCQPGMINEDLPLLKAVFGALFRASVELSGGDKDTSEQPIIWPSLRQHEKDIKSDSRAKLLFCDHFLKKKLMETEF